MSFRHFRTRLKTAWLTGRELLDFQSHVAVAAGSSDWTWGFAHRLLQVVMLGDRSKLARLLTRVGPLLCAAPLASPQLTSLSRSLDADRYDDSVSPAFEFASHYGDASLPPPLLVEVSSLALGGSSAVLPHMAMGFLSGSTVLMLDALGIGQLTFAPFVHALAAADAQSWQVGPDHAAMRLVRAMCVYAEVERIAADYRQRARARSLGSLSNAHCDEVAACRAMFTLPVWAPVTTISRSMPEYSMPEHLIVDSMPKPDDLDPVASLPHAQEARACFLSDAEIESARQRSYLEPAGRHGLWDALSEAQLAVMRLTPVWSAVRHDFYVAAFGSDPGYTRAERVAALVYFTVWNGQAHNLAGAPESVGAMPARVDGGTVSNVQLHEFWASLYARLCNFHALHWVRSAMKRFLIPCEDHGKVAVIDTVPLAFRRWNLTELHAAHTHLWLDLALSFSDVIRAGVKHLIDWSGETRACIDGNADIKLAIDAYVLGALDACPSKAALLAFQKRSGKGWDGDVANILPHPLSSVRRKVVYGYGQTKTPYSDGKAYISDTKGRLRNLLVALLGFGLVVLALDVVVGGGPNGKAGQSTDLPWDSAASYEECARMMRYVRELLSLRLLEEFVRRTSCAFEGLARVQTLQASDFTDLAVCACLYFRDLTDPAATLFRPGRPPTFMRHCVPPSRLPPPIVDVLLTWPPAVFRARGLGLSKYLKDAPSDAQWMSSGVPSLPTSLWAVSVRVRYWRSLRLTSETYKLLLEAGRLKLTAGARVQLKLLHWRRFAAVAGMLACWHARAKARFYYAPGGIGYGIAAEDFAEGARQQQRK